MILQPRDRLLSKKLIRFGVLSTRQIENLCFSGIAHTTLMRRLRLLEKSRYVRRGVTLADGTNTWSVGRQGIQALGSGNQYHFTNRNGIHHDVLLADVRITLERMNLGFNWTPEFEMKAQAMRNFGRERQKRLLPDGVLVESVWGANRSIAVELELTQKSRTRYSRLISEYASKAIDHIWYFYKHPGIRRAVLQQAERSSYSLRGTSIWFVGLDDFLKNGEHAQIYSTASKKSTSVSDFGFDAFQSPKDQKLPDHGVSRQILKKPLNQTTLTSSSCNGNLESAKPKGGTASAPDPTPPTMNTSGGLGSGATAVEEVKEGRENELRKCG